MVFLPDHLHYPQLPAGHLSHFDPDMNQKMPKTVSITCAKIQLSKSLSNGKFTGFPGSPAAPGLPTGPGDPYKAVELIS